MVWVYTLISVFLVSFIAFTGIFFLSLKKSVLEKLLLFLVSFAVGALVGDAFLHLLPEVLKAGLDPFTFAVYALFGIVIFFIIEKVLRWQHRHLFKQHQRHQHKHPMIKPYVWMNLFGDGIHNFVDGMIIAGSFMVSVPLGVTTSFAVLLHEGAQEIGDFAILVKGGLTRAKALMYNFLSALVSVVGAVLTLLIGSRISGLENFLIPFTFAGFIYIAFANLIPELHEEDSPKQLALQVVGLLLGIGVMAGLLYV